MTKRAKLIALISTISFCIVLTLVLWIFMPVCGACGNRLCFGSCLKTPQQVQPVDDSKYEKPNGVLSTQLTETAEASDAYMENVYFMTTFSIETYTDNFTLRRDFDFTNLLSVGGWHTFSPLENEKCGKLGISDPKTDIVEKDHVYVISLENVKSNIISAYSLVTSGNWDEINTFLTKAEAEYDTLMNSTYDLNEVKRAKFNRCYVLLKELIKTSNAKDENLFYLKYINLMNEFEEISF